METILSDRKNHVKLTFRKINENTYQYIRNIGETEVEKTLIMSSNEIGIYPTTPNVTYPEYSEYIYIKFSKEVVVEGNGEVDFFVKAPVGIVLALKNNEVFDGFTLNEKHALYGSLVKGVLTRYFTSKIYFSKPNDLSFSEAAVKVKVINASDEVAKVSRIVFPITGIPVYYGSNGYEAFYTNVAMKIVNHEIAEVTVLDEEPLVNLRKSPIKIGSLKKSFIMEWGI